MRGFVNSAVTTLFVLVLLLVVPIVAVVGIPEFVPVVASSSQSLEGTERELELDEGVGESAIPYSSDLFAGFDAAAPPGRLAATFDVANVQARSNRDRGPVAVNNGSLDGWDVDERGRVIRSRRSGPEETNAFASADDVLGESVSIDAQPRGQRLFEPYESSPSPHDRRPESSREPLTWTSAVERLNALGIREYSLDPGLGGRDFHFACDYAVDGNPNHARRFEADATEPLQAVERVFAQIDDWRARRQ